MSRYIKTKFSDIPTYTFALPIKDLLHIAYTAPRHLSSEEGAVQRILNKKRVGEITDFILAGNRFFSNFILNWTHEQKTPAITDDDIILPTESNAAQIIDGQHRLAGLKLAVKQKASIGEEKVLVSLCLHLTTSQAAKIFLNINSEQKPVPKSLIYDLFGEIEDDSNHPIVRANDIITFLHTRTDSPYQGQFKYPNEKRGNIPLSTAVNEIKKYLVPHEEGFYTYDLKSFEHQAQTILNFFCALQDFYADNWDKKTFNPFLSSAAFTGAIDFLISKLLPECKARASAKQETFKKLLETPFSKQAILQKKDLQKLDGKSAIRKVISFLNYTEAAQETTNYEF